MIFGKRPHTLPGLPGLVIATLQTLRPEMYEDTLVERRYTLLPHSVMLEAWPEKGWPSELLDRLQKHLLSFHMGGRLDFYVVIKQTYWHFLNTANVLATDLRSGMVEILWFEVRNQRSEDILS